MQNLEQILAELLKAEPSLKTHEKEVRLILEQMLLAKPEIQLNEQFILNLRQKLLTHIGSPKSVKNLNFNIFDFNFMKKYIWTFSSFGIVVVMAILVFTLQSNHGEPTLLTQIFKPKINKNPTQLEPIPLGGSKSNTLKTFANKEEFLAYLQEAQSSSPAYGGRGGGGGVALDALQAQPMTESKMTKSALPTSPAVAPSPDRVSQTNVQTQGIDEPDIVKTDGKNIYISTDAPYYVTYAEPMLKIANPELENPNADIRIAPPMPTAQQSKIVSALPMKLLGKIDKQGELLLSGSTLMVFTYEGIFAYDISNPERPKESWKIKYENSQLVSARLNEGKVYLVTRSFVDYSAPCPLKPLALNGKAIEIACPRIYYPTNPVGDTATFSAIQIDPNTGDVKNKLAFVGSYSQSLVYMSENNLYITYGYSKKQLDVMNDFLSSDGKGLYAEVVVNKLKKLSTYDISDQAKEIEMQNILQKYLSNLSEDDRLKFQNEMQNKIGSYLKTHSRELYSTGIVKISLNKFELNSTGFVPGNILNQFSLDEFQNNLRVATTIGQNFWIWGWQGGNSETVNDVYVLDPSLNQIGTVKDLGKGEQIYSARFVGKLGYLVTFRQTDPFYVLDLSNPKNPQKTGELKIPGYSSYLHPLAENLILGIGQENGKVKLSLFDVSNTKDPKEIDKYSLDEYWTEASNNHHAFLQDEKHSVFFLPGGQGGYVFSYKNGKLNLEKAVSKVVAKRALYINDLLYIVGTDKIVAIDENTWERVKELDLR